MGMGSAFMSGYGSGRAPIHHIDISKYLGGGTTTVKGRAPIVDGPSVLDEDAAKKEEQSRYDQEAAMKQEKQDADINHLKTADQIAEQNATLNRDKMWQDRNIAEDTHQMTKDQHRRMQGFQKAVMGLHGRDTQLLQDGWAELLPGGGALQETKGKDGKISIEQIIPRFSFNGDGSVDVEMPGGEKARAGSAQEIYKMLLAPLNPATEKPKDEKVGFFDQEQYKSLLKEKADLQKYAATGVNKDGFAIPPEQIQATADRIAAIDKQLKTIDKSEKAGSLKYSREKIAEPGAEKPEADKTPAAQGKPLDVDTAKAILKEAGGDKNKARKIAKERGYDLSGKKKKKKKKGGDSSEGGGGDSGDGGGDAGGGGGNGGN